MSVVQKETATVWRGGVRRYFSKRAAYEGAARARMWKLRPCDCCPGSPEHYGADGNACYLHSLDPGSFRVLVQRFGRLLAAQERGR